MTDPEHDQDLGPDESPDAFEAPADNDPMPQLPADAGDTFTDLDEGTDTGDTDLDGETE